MRSRVAAVVALTLAACAAPRDMPAPAPPPGAPYVLVLGTAQDGGRPQIGCRLECCRSARRDPSLARHVTSLALVDPRTGRRWLFDATPHLPAQVELAEGHGGPRAEEPGRPALFDGIFITHAHVGHYAGLMLLGREVYGSAATALFGTPRLVDYLASNGPWSLLIEAGHIAPEPLAPGATVELGEDLRVTALQVPHRDEFSDTVAFLIEGPGASLLYLPDIDKWERWDTRIEDVVARVDFALVDGTFFGPDEVQGRPMAEIPHPFIVESMERFAPLSATERAKIRFTHLNHSNPAATPGSPEARAVRRAGFGLVADGDTFTL